MIAHPKMSRNEWKVTEMGVSKVGNVARVSRQARRGVKNGDELIEVNGRRVEYVVASDAAHGTVRAAMLAACDVVRDAPWPKRLVFRRAGTG